MHPSVVPVPKRSAYFQGSHRDRGQSEFAPGHSRPFAMKQLLAVMHILHAVAILPPFLYTLNYGFASMDIWGPTSLF